ncbi:unnamed protein product [Gongylonema pulchrum]|uniref:Uncharacterized protein n=1 Tax=Gongylonema pulchrum TaxID=637853 RepID=A0A3P6QLK5_9BILA|nr:unnamed protein product [Gongylonema pulchrum]
MQAREDADTARICAKQFAPEFKQPGTEVLRMHMKQQYSGGTASTANHVSFDSPPASKGSHESRDLSDEVVILNAPSLPGSTPAGSYPMQNPAVAGNLYQQYGSSVPPQLMANPETAYRQQQQQQQPVNAGDYQGASGYQVANPSLAYSQQQLQGVTAATGYPGPQQSALGPNYYQALPSVSSSYNQATGYTTGAPLPASGPNLPVIQASSSSYLPNAVPHSAGVPHQYHQQQHHHHHLLASHYPVPGTTTVSDRQAVIIHPEPSSLQDQQPSGASAIPSDQQQYFADSYESPQSTASRNLLQVVSCCCKRFFY